MNWFHLGLGQLQWRLGSRNRLSYVHRNHSRLSWFFGFGGQFNFLRLKNHWLFDFNLLLDDNLGLLVHHYFAFLQCNVGRIEKVLCLLIILRFSRFFSFLALYQLLLFHVDLILSLHNFAGNLLFKSLKFTHFFRALGTLV